MPVLIMYIVNDNDSPETMRGRALFFQLPAREKCADKKAAIEECCDNISDSTGQRFYMTSSGGRYGF